MCEFHLERVGAGGSSGEGPCWRHGAGPLQEPGLWEYVPLPFVLTLWPADDLSCLSGMGVVWLWNAQ